MRLLVLKLAKLVPCFKITALHMEYVTAFMAGVIESKILPIVDMLLARGSTEQLPVLPFRAAKN